MSARNPGHLVLGGRWRVSMLKQRIGRLERILSVSRDLTSMVALEPLLKRIVDTAAELTASEAASILLESTRTG